MSKYQKTNLILGAVFLAAFVFGGYEFFINNKEKNQQTKETNELKQEIVNTETTNTEKTEIETISSPCDSLSEDKKDECLELEKKLMAFNQIMKIKEAQQSTLLKQIDEIKATLNDNILSLSEEEAQNDLLTKKQHFLEMTRLDLEKYSKLINQIEKEIASLTQVKRIEEKSNNSATYLQNPTTQETISEAQLKIDKEAYNSAKERLKLDYEHELTALQAQEAAEGGREVSPSDCGGNGVQIQECAIADRIHNRYQIEYDYLENTYKANLKALAATKYW